MARDRDEITSHAVVENVDPRGGVHVPLVTTSHRPYVVPSLAGDDVIRTGAPGGGRRIISRGVSAYDPTVRAPSGTIHNGRRSQRETPRESASLYLSFFPASRLLFSLDSIRLSLSRCPVQCAPFSRERYKLRSAIS